MSLFQSLKRRLPDLRYDSEFWRRTMRAGVVHGPEAFIRLSPPLFGWGFALAMPAVRERVAANLRIAGRKGSALEIAAVFSNYALSLTEAFAVGAGRSERISACIRGDTNFQEARAMKRGVIVATAHTSGWYAAGPILGSVYDDEVLLVMQDERDPRAQRVQQQSRDAMGLRVVHVGTDPLAAMPLLAHLKKGGIVALQADRAPNGVRNIEVTLGGAPFHVPEGPLTLAALSGAPLVVVLARRCSFLQYEVEVGPAITVARRPSRQDMEAAAKALSSAIESFVRRHPTDWFHFER